jgi:asparagine synthase (glutamine-hydrolysing)
VCKKIERLPAFAPTGSCLWHGKNPQEANHHAALVLGHRRLSIIDPTESSAQPLSSHSGRYWITFNGEIYNYIELRNQLQNLGHSFITQGDTEVILKAYAHWGRDCVNHFNGMWAFAIWDTQNQTLFCSRDRLGIKPFYYSKSNQRFTFASEIKSVLASLSSSEHQLNEPYLARFILHGLLNDGQETLFKSIYQLLPAHCLEIYKGQIKMWRYWDIPQQSIQNADRATIEPQQAIEQFRELLTDAIRLRFRADVPVGTNLSGGLDSSTIVALATQRLASTFDTFTVEYPEPEFAEGHHARRVAEACKTNAHYVTPSHENYIDFIERFSWFHDEPSVGSGMFSQWHVMQLASQNVKVVLDGQGADELLGGYQHYFYPYLTALLKDNPKHFYNAQRAIANHQQRTLPAFAISWAKQTLGPLLPKNTLAGHRILHSLANKNILDQAMPFYKPRSLRYRDDLNNALYYELT